MNSPLHSALTLSLLLITFHLFSHVTSNSLHHHHHHHHHPTTTHIRGLLVYEEKLSRLGSRPPSCHNKCNLCHPCMPVQVPTLPGHNRVDPTVGYPYYDQPPSTSRYSNYKPLGWKCRCDGHLYNP